MRGKLSTTHCNLLLGACVLSVAVTSCRREETKTTAPKPSASATRPQPPWFEDVTLASGVDFVHTSGNEDRFWFPEIMTGGVGLFDYDRDGDLDLYLVQAGAIDPAITNLAGNKLYRNHGDGTFEEVTDAAGVGDTGYGMGCTCGDFNGDGFVDLYVTNVGPNVLYRNNGDGTFLDVSATAGVTDSAWGASAAFVDYDADGDLDLFITNYVDWTVEREIDCSTKAGIRTYCSPNNYTAPAPDTLLRNNGDGTFNDVSEESGVRKIFGNAMGVACGDYNGDGFVDIYVANDGMPNQLWMNDGKGRFSDEALIWGCAVNMQGQSEAGMGVTVIDIDHDGDLDLFLSHLNQESNTFYLNEGEWFSDATSVMGLTGPSLESTGFGLGFSDFNHDGILDLYVANGRVAYVDPPLDPKRLFIEPNQLYSSRDGSLFFEVMPRGGTKEPSVEASRGAAFGDIDNDGDTDIVVVNIDARPQILRNIAGDRGHWIMFRVLNARGGYALNADVQIEAGRMNLRRRVQRAYSYCASNDPRVHFGLGASTSVDCVTVRWPDGTKKTFGPFSADASYDLPHGGVD